MPSLLACYRYPVKGMTPESLQALRLESGRSPDGDRALAFVFANAQPLDADGCVDKHHALTLLNTPGLARITAAADAASRVLSLRTADVYSVRPRWTASRSGQRWRPGCRKSCRGLR